MEELTKIVLMICFTVAVCWIAYCNRYECRYHNSAIVPDTQVVETQDVTEEWKTKLFFAIEEVSND